MTFIKNNSYLFLIIGLCFLFAYAGTIKSQSSKVYEEITVSKGDTLWGLALQYADNKPTDKWIEEVMKLNNLSSATIITGEELRLPSMKGVGTNEIANHIAGDEQ